MSLIEEENSREVAHLLNLMVLESQITSYFNIYFAKSRKAWVVHYGQSRKVESDNIISALNEALKNLISERNSNTINKYTLYDSCRRS